MGWFLGCFGCRSKKNRKHRTPSSPLPKQQNPSYVVPVRLTVAVSSSIPIKGVPGQERPSQEDFFTVSSSAPARHNEGVFLQNAVVGSRSPERQQKPGPWYQLDDLEEELEDLRKQIDKESQDAKKIKGEVGFSKSSGTLVKTPSDLKSPQKIDHEQGSMPEGEWRPRCAPSVSPNTRIPLVKNFQFEGLKAALCEPTPAKECHSLLLGVQTPVSSMRVMQSTAHQSMQAQVHEEQLNQFKNGDIFDHAVLPCQEGIDNKLAVDIEPSQSNLSMSSPCLDSEKFLNKGKLDDTLDGRIQRPKGILKQSNMSLCGIESNSSKGDIENENNLPKKRRLAVNLSSVQSPHSLKKPVEADVGNVPDHDIVGQKRLKAFSPVEQSKKERNNASSQADPVPVHFFRCDSLSPIIESGMCIEDSTSYDNKGSSPGPSHQLHSYNSNNSTSQTSIQSPSMRQSPASHSKSVTFTSTNDEEYTTDELSYNCRAVEKYSEGSYTNSTCFNDSNEEDEEDGLATASYSPSTDSEETLSDLSPEHCFSPPISSSQAKNCTVYRLGENSTTIHEKRVANSHSISSTQYSSVYGGKKKQHVSRYDSEEDDITEDDYDLFADAVSHVSTECSEREHRRWHSRTESMDSVSTHFTQLGRATDSNSIDTPPKLSEWIATPNVNIPGRAGQHTSRLRRSKPASSVLTPVENVSQWKQLKERDQKLDVIAKAGGDESSKTDPIRLTKRLEDSSADIWDENKNLKLITPSKAEGKQLAPHGVPMSVNARQSHWQPASDAEPVNVNASLSHWGIASEADSIRVDASLSQWGTRTTETEPVRVDMSLSHWLKSSSKRNEAHKLLGTSTATSSSGESGVISPAPKLQTKEYVSPNLATRTQKSQSSSYVRSERPIIGALGGDCPSRNANQRSPWDGKGTPNSTAKYMEDQRVKWHLTPFEQRLEKALDKQGILLQKKLFVATPVK